MTRYHRHKAVKKSLNRTVSEKAALAVAIIEPVVTIPQAWDIFRDHTAAGVSLSTWVGYEFLTVIWLWYGVVHREKIILVYQGLYMVVQTAIIIGAVTYGAKW